MGFYALNDERTSGETAAVPARPRPEQTDPPSKNRVWNFFDASQDRVGQNPTFGQCSRRENRPATTKTASGRPLWPNRAPMEEAGRDNIYSFTLNSTILYIEVTRAIAEALVNNASRLGREGTVSAGRLGTLWSACDFVL